MNAFGRTERAGAIRPRALLGALFAPLMVATLLVGGTASASAKSSWPTLTVGIGSVNADYASFWVAQAEKLFERNHVNVDVVDDNTANNAAVMVASGQAELMLFTAGLGLELASQGKQVQNIYTFASFSASSFGIISSKSVTSVAQLRSMSGCRLATNSPGNSTYTYALRYMAAEGLHCSLVIEATAPATLAAVGSGSVQVGVVPYTVGLPAVNAGVIHQLLNPLQVPAALARRIVSTSYPAYVVFGLKSTLAAHAAAVTRFVRALREANAVLLGRKSSVTGREVAALPAWSGATPTIVTNGYLAVRSQIPTGPDAGFISAASWKTALAGYAGWSLPGFSVNSPAVDYAHVINMSYFKAAGSAKVHKAA